jgi:probable F420-dependent oxidoreductase
MRIGLAAIGIGPGARPAILCDTARAADAAGFATLWMGEHVVLFEQPQSKYPYSEGGEFSLPPTIDWLDPFVALSFAAAATQTIRLATGICLVPEHEPLSLAKTAASLDRLSGGRFTLGVGAGWLVEEFAALGVPFARRAQRMREYIAVMRRLWSEETTSVDGEFVHFAGAHSFPKPTQGGRLPVIVGGESRAALARAAEYGDGWYGFNLSPDEAAGKIAQLRALLAERDRAATGFEIVVAPFTKPVTPDDLERYRAHGVGEVVLVTPPPQDEAAVPSWIEGLARQWVDRAAALG